MKGILLDNVSHTTILSFSEATSKDLCAAWAATTLDDMLSSLPEDVTFDGDELSHHQRDIPWLASTGYLSMTTTVVRARTKRASAFLVGSSWNVLASGDLEDESLFDFYRDEYDGNQANLSWYAKRVEEIEGLAAWSIWNGLPDPIEAGARHLLVVQHADQVRIFAEVLQKIIDAEVSVGDHFCSVAAREDGGAKISIVDARDELLRVARRCL